MKKTHCEICGKVTSRSDYTRCNAHRHNLGLSFKGKHHSLKSKLLMSKARKGDKCCNWKGGRIQKETSHGYKYIVIYSPTHPNKDSKGYVLEHRLIMEKFLGRVLSKEETVHHIDNNPLNNNISNLMLFKSKGAHISFHRQAEIKTRIFKSHERDIFGRFKNSSDRKEVNA